MQIFSLSNDWICPSSSLSFSLVSLNSFHISADPAHSPTLSVDDFISTFMQKIEIIRRAPLDKLPPDLLIRYCLFTPLTFTPVTMGKCLCCCQCLHLYLGPISGHLFKSIVLPIFPYLLYQGSAYLFCKRPDSILPFVGLTNLSLFFQ